jgi:hypothetical protein
VTGILYTYTLLQDGMISENNVKLSCLTMR